MPHSSAGGNDEESNPFVAFKRQIDSVFQNFTGADNLFRAFENELQTAFEKFGDSYERATNPERKQLEGREEVGLRSRRSKLDERHPSSCPKAKGRPEDVSERFKQLSEQNPWFSTPFLFESVYSPRFLELEDDRNGLRPEKRIYWRGAFCDLMATLAQMDDQWKQQVMQPVVMGQGGKMEELNTKPGQAIGIMVHPEEFGGTRNGRMVFPFSPRTDGLDRSQVVREIQYDFQRRGRLEQILDRTLPEQGSETELDMYEHVARSASATDEYESFLQSIGCSDKVVPPRATAEAVMATTPEPKPSVIATMTTVQSFTRPDGSIETHRVLKKRFADGKEEVDDRTEVTPAPVEHERRFLKKRDGQIMQDLNKRDQSASKKSGWFWSSS